MRTLVTLSGWLVVIGGLLWGYEGLTNVDLVQSILPGIEPIIDIIIGVAALIVGYSMLTRKMA